MQTGNFLINTKARQYQWSGDCFLSIKSFNQGTAHYQVQQREYAVNDANFLVLNECTRYRLTIDSSCEVESFCIFFCSDFVTQAIADSSASFEDMLEHNSGATALLKFTERKFHRSGGIADLLLLGKSQSQHFNSFQWSEYYYAIFSALIQQQGFEEKAAERLHLCKRTTRLEMYRRLYYAKDFIACNFSKNLTLQDIAQVAMLSQNHLLRNFKVFFGVSPFTMIARLKMSEAKHQVMNTDKSISQIASDLGYESLSNFSYSFSRATGNSPNQFRKKVK